MQGELFTVKTVTKPENKLPLYEEIENVLLTIGAIKIRHRFELNGLKIIVKKTKIYWPPEIDLASLGVSLSAYSSGDGKPFSKLSKKNFENVKSIVGILKTCKSDKLRKKEAKAARKYEKLRKHWIDKRDFCNGCPFTEQPKDNRCSKMEMYKDVIYYCGDVNWWNNWYCKNAERIFTENPYLGYFQCKINKRRCPYSKPSSIHKESERLVGMQACPSYVPGNGYIQKE